MGAQEGRWECGVRNREEGAESGHPGPTWTFNYLWMSVWSHSLFFKNLILFFNFTILYWFCHISTWICHRYTRVPLPESSSLLPPRTIPLAYSLLFCSHNTETKNKKTSFFFFLSKWEDKKTLRLTYSTFQVGPICWLSSRSAQIMNI